MMRRMLVVIGLCMASAAGAVPLQYPEGDLWGFPALSDLQGKLLGRGRFGQWVDGRGIHVKVNYDQLNGDRIEETALMSTARSQLAQREWTWQRASGGQVVERYAMSFDTGEARAVVLKNGRREEHRAKLRVVDGETFCGIGFVFAVRNLEDRLARGEKVELEGIAFLPRPRQAKVLVSAVGVEQLRSGGRSMRADHIVVHPQVPRVARLFVNVPDSHLWFYRANPPAFLRAQMQVLSLGMVRIDAVSGVSAPPAQARPGRPPSR